jgi:hypothetical protein
MLTPSALVADLRHGMLPVNWDESDLSAICMTWIDIWCDESARRQSIRGMFKQEQKHFNEEIRFL